MPQVHPGDGGPPNRPAQGGSQSESSALFAFNPSDQLRYPETVVTARHRVVQIARDLENAESAAASEWGDVQCKALFCNILCWTLPIFGACCYCIEANASPTAQYVHDIQTMQHFKALVEDIRKARPVLRLGIQCSHTETHSDGNGGQSTRTVVTKTASEEFSGFAAVLDETPSADEMWALVAETHRPIVEGEVLLVQVHINALPMNEASQEALRAHALHWFNAQKSDQTQVYSWSWEMDTSGFQTQWPSGGRLTLVPGSNKPEWLSPDKFQRSLCLGCAYCYRKKLFENARKVNFHINKHFQMPGTPAVGPEAVTFSVRKGVPKMAQFLPPVPTPVWCPTAAQNAGGVPVSAAPFGAQQAAPLSQNSMAAVPLGAERAGPSQPAATTTSYCPECGAAKKAGTKFCSQCGQAQPG